MVDPDGMQGFLSELFGVVLGVLVLADGGAGMEVAAVVESRRGDGCVGGGGGTGG